MYPYMYNMNYLLFALPGLILAMIAQAKVSSAFRDYSQVNSNSGMTGQDVARQILNRNGLTNVRIERIRGNLTDHYDPRDKVLRLSDSVYNSTSVAALGVAAHEVGHAMQDAENYKLLSFRNSLVPVANLGSNAAYLLVFLGLLFQNSTFFINLGVALFLVVVLFHVVTYPVEINASKRAMEELSNGIMTEQGLRGAREVLKAASMTYFASLITSIGTLLHLLHLSRNRRN